MSRAELPYVDVALDIPGSEPFTYSLPQDLRPLAGLGMRAEVPVGKRRMIGVIVGFRERTHLLCKPVAAILDREPVLDDHLLWLTYWVSQRYLCSWGQAIWAALPPGLNRRQRTMAKLLPVSEPMALSLDEARMVDILKGRGRASLDWLRQRFGDGASKILASLEQKGMLSLDIEWHGGRERQSKERWLVKFKDEAPQGLSPARAKLWALLATKGEIPIREVTSKSAAAWLVERGLAAWEMRDSQQLPGPALSLPEAEVAELTEDQRQALQGVEENLAREDFSVSLLFGVTASGKTEVYLRAAGLAASQGKQILVLVPEIGLVGQMAARFKKHFPSLGIWHSELSAGQRYDVWSAARKQRISVLVGVRSAVFCPLPKLGLIIIDEEQDASYKQQDADPLYHARSVAFARARRLRIPVILGSATPSVESYWCARNGTYQLFTMPHRVSPWPQPELQVVDCRQAERTGSIISPDLGRAISREVAQGRQVMLLLNRRGYARSLQCSRCGAVLRCRNCAISLSYHRGEDIMLCHYCGYRQRSWTQCPQCGNPRLRTGSQGIQRLEEDLKKLFPGWPVIRMDSDTTERKGSHERILKTFQDGRAKILIGTQMIAKGHHFPAVGLVGVLNIDEMMALPDFRSSERVGQLLLQMSGRAGRGEHPGQVIVQTRWPQASIFISSLGQGYQQFLEEELRQRQEAGYPPFKNIVLITVAAADEEMAKQKAVALAGMISRKDPEIIILGPAPAAIPKLRGRFRYQLLLKHDDLSPLLEACRGLGRRERQVSIRIDTEPVSTL